MKDTLSSLGVMLSFLLLWCVFSLISDKGCIVTIDGVEHRFKIGQGQ